VVDHTTPGWIPSLDNIAKMQRTIGSDTSLGSAYVFDLLGNSSLRYEQFDGTTALPFKMGGRFHFGGKVVTTPPEIFKKTVESIVPIIMKKGGNPGVIIPPLPRGLFSRCCKDDGHCTNVNDENFAAELLSGFIGLRTDLIRHLVKAGISNFKVLDACCVTNCVTTANLPEQLEGLQKVTLADGIHFNQDGYSNMVDRAFKCIETMSSSPKTKRISTHFWRGFRSPKGAVIAPEVVGRLPATRTVQRGRMRGGNAGRQYGGFHPYKRW
jgi:hypothetical protein